MFVVFAPSLIHLSELQPLSALRTLVALVVSKLERSRLLRDEHPLNMQNIFVTLEVLKLETSIDSKLEQPLNI